MNRTKLRSILKALSPNEVKIDFSSFDNDISQLKESLKERVQPVDLEPLLISFKNLKKSVTAKNEELVSLLNTKQQQLTDLIKQSDSANEERISQLITEIAVLSVRKIEIPDFAKQIKDTESKLMAVIDTAKIMDSLEDEKENEATQAQFALLEKAIKELKSQLQTRGGGSMPFKVSINDTVLSTRYADINFKGSGITYTASDNNTTKQVDLTLTVSSSSTNFVDNEVVPGSGTTFTLANTPVLGSEHIFADRQRLYPTTDYTISGAVITTILSYSTGDLLADYRK